MSDPRDSVKVLVTERVSLPRATVRALLDAITAAFRSEHRVVSLVYRRGDPLVVERMVPSSEVQDLPDLMTPFQLVRQYADVEEISGGDPLSVVATACQRISDKKATVSSLVCGSRREVQKWAEPYRLEDIFRLPLLEDPESPEGMLLICGSQTGDAMVDVDTAFFVQMEE